MGESARRPQLTRRTAAAVLSRISPVIAQCARIIDEEKAKLIQPG